MFYHDHLKEDGEVRGATRYLLVKYLRPRKRHPYGEGKFPQTLSKGLQQSRFINNQSALQVHTGPVIEQDYKAKDVASLQRQGLGVYETGMKGVTQHHQRRWPKGVAKRTGFCSVISLVESKMSAVGL